MAKYYQWDIDKIYLYPFGGHIKFNTNLNQPIKQELYILLMGFIFQHTLYLLIYFLHHIDIIFTSTYYIVKNYHYAILFFNLIPIFPLDGAKLYNLIMNTNIPYKISNKVMIYSSYFCLIILTIIIIRFYFNINLFLICILLLSKINEESRNHELKFNKFLLERYLNDFNFYRLKLIKNDNINKIFRDRRHIFRVNNNYITEKEMLKKRFK